MMDPKWEVFKYEYDMAFALSGQLAPDTIGSLAWELKNAVIESLVLHTRILCDIIMPKSNSYPDDITLEKLVPGLTPATIADLKTAYGASNLKDSPCWQFNKLLAHPTTNRSGQHEYLPALKQVWPHLEPILNEINAAFPAET